MIRPTQAARTAVARTRTHVEAAAYRAGWNLAVHVPQPVVDRALRVTADQLYGRGGSGIERLRSNLARAVPDADAATLDAVTRDAMRSYLRYWGEVFRLPRFTGDVAAVDDAIVVDHAERVYALRDAGRGMIAALPHMGNWDLMGAWACTHEVPLMTVMERLKPERLYDEFVAFRERIGMTVLPLTGGPPTMPQLAEHLRAGGFVCLLADRDMSRSGIPVDLLGEKARMPVGPALLAQQTGATLFVATSRYDDDAGRLRMTVHEPIETRSGEDGLVAMTQDVADVFTTDIRRSPADWHMLQRVFEVDRRDDGGRPGKGGAR
ncbi:MULTISPECIES: phosphatidylinositol mannoside acyltransferase [Mumia]|uniref:phosphatidylinositol mannoside acyltransferase n=1 Tax=Mumia TaxID=1546255 RepID=UPI00141EFF76|nr:MULTISPECIES: phosphatidylinositol mannoside acyltransferase [unclassified Mumia]QMW67938.1 phosphatidylinositol mannoside acyltransferase [Mumia sp. ZJ1417]